MGSLSQDQFQRLQQRGDAWALPSLLGDEEKMTREEDPLTTTSGHGPGILVWPKPGKNVGRPEQGLLLSEVYPQSPALVPPLQFTSFVLKSKLSCSSI